MALVNDAKREINAKIVYMGPKGSGKGSALRYIYSKLKPEYRSELKVIPAGEHQMLFFDFIYPQSSGAGGYKLRFHLYTLLAGGETIPPWKMLLKGADGLVFLADTASERLVDNMNSASLLRDSLTHYGMDLNDTPLAVQGNNSGNQRANDLSGLMTKLFPEVVADAAGVSTGTGEGVLEGLHTLIKAITARLGQSDTDAAEGSVGSSALENNFSAEVSAPVAAKGLCEGARFCVELAGESTCDQGGTIHVPLRLVSPSGESSSLLTLKISLTT